MNACFADESIRQEDRFAGRTPAGFETSLAEGTAREMRAAASENLVLRVILARTFDSFRDPLVGVGRHADSIPTKCKLDVLIRVPASFHRACPCVDCAPTSRKLDTIAGSPSSMARPSNRWSDGTEEHFVSVKRYIRRSPFEDNGTKGVRSNRPAQRTSIIPANRGVP